MHHQPIPRYVSFYQSTACIIETWTNRVFFLFPFFFFVIAKLHFSFRNVHCTFLDRKFGGSECGSMASMHTTYGWNIIIYGKSWQITTFMHINNFLFSIYHIAVKFSPIRFFYPRSIHRIWFSILIHIWFIRCMRLHLLMSSYFKYRLHINIIILKKAYSVYALNWYAPPGQ